MEKITGGLVLILIALAAAFCYVVYEVWHIFGVWAMLVSIFANGIAKTFFGQLMGSKTKTATGYMFNPRELPKFLAILTAIVVGYYLYTQMASQELTPYDYKFGMFWLVTIVFLPIAYSIYILIRDRNDYVEITDQLLKYKNNDDVGELSLTSISNVELASGGLQLTLNDGQEFLIKTSEMNFNAKDVFDLVTTLNESLATVNKVHG
jgi:hypothetical protein